LKSACVFFWFSLLFYCVFIPGPTQHFICPWHNIAYFCQPTVAWFCIPVRRQLLASEKWHHAHSTIYNINSVIWKCLYISVCRRHWRASSGWAIKPVIWWSLAKQCSLHSKKLLVVFVVHLVLYKILLMDSHCTSILSLKYSVTDARIVASRLNIVCLLK